MHNDPKRQLSKPSLDELTAIKEELIEIKKELKSLNSNLAKQIASGVSLALIAFAVLSAVIAAFLYSL